jgi:hypothetical protein
MSITLFDMLVPSYIQILEGLVGTLQAGRAHCEAHGMDPDDLVQLRLAPDMQPLSYQVFAAANHSAGAIATLKDGRFHSPSREPINSYVELERIALDALEACRSLTSDDVNPYADGEVLFETEKFRLRFSAADFIHTFSLPNFYFHVTTAYDLLRMKGVHLIKLNFLGNMRMISSEGL